MLRAWAATATGTVELPRMEDVHRAFTETDASIWVDLIEPTASLLSDLTLCLDLHPLIVEDILERNQRAKIELTGPHLHLVLFAMEYQTGLSVEEIDIVLGERFLLTAHPAAWDPTATPSLRTASIGTSGRAPTTCSGRSSMASWTPTFRCTTS